MMGPFFFYEFFSPTKQSVDSRQISSKIKASKTEECTSKTRGSHLLVDQRSSKENYYERAKSMFSPPCGQSHFERVISSSSSSSLSSSQITSNYRHQPHEERAAERKGSRNSSRTRIIRTECEAIKRLSTIQTSHIRRGRWIWR